MSEESNSELNKTPQELLDTFADKFKDDEMIEAKKQVVQTLKEIYKLSQDESADFRVIETGFTEFMAAASPPEEERSNLSLTDEQLDYLDPVIGDIDNKVAPNAVLYDLWRQSRHGTE